MATTLRHGAHGQYLLQLMKKSDTNVIATRCNGCEKPSKTGRVDVLYGCLDCRFFLHRCCALLSQFQLPSLSLQSNSALHTHVLQPLYAPAYPSGAFRCNICWKAGSGFNYHCHSCSFDAHFLCALMPQTVSSQVHQHSLQLWFPPFVGRTICDICRRQIDHCRYRCGNCNYDAHPGCLIKAEEEKRFDAMVGRLARWVGRKFFMHLLFDPLGGLGEVMDTLLFGSVDVPNITDICSLLPASFLDLRALHVVDDRIRKELVSLLRAHMKEMVGG